MRSLFSQSLITGRLFLWLKALGKRAATLGAAVFALIFALQATLGGNAFAADPTGGFNLTEIGNFVYDAAESGQPKNPLQQNIDKLYDLGVRHLLLNPRAFMYGPRSNELVPVTKAADRNKERDRYTRLIKYIKSKGMTVGIRPIFFVVDANRNPFREKLPDGTLKLWWHGNIQPADPNTWFESFKTYLDSYLLIAKLNKVEEFTIGAELYSMTVGIEDQWAAHPHGFPGRWLDLLRYARSRLAPNTRIMYDINFTDDKNSSSDLDTTGGEFERWRYRLVDLAEPADEAQYAIWKNLLDFWNGLDAIGIDMYRSLASRSDAIPTDSQALTTLLQRTSDRYASQIDNALAEIDFVSGKSKPIYLKEIGFRSIKNGFIEPFGWDAGGNGLDFNEQHQAVAFDALLSSFWGANWPWLKGINFWDVSADPSKHGPKDKGFSPIGKPQTESVLKKWFGVR